MEGGFFTNVYAVDINRPSFFEIVAKENLLDSLRPAVRFVVQIFIVRSPTWASWLDKWEWVYNLTLLVVEERYLKNHQASFAEYFFGMQREALAPGGGVSSPLEALEQERQRQAAPELSPKEKWGSLFFLVVMPAIKEKCEREFRRLETEQLQQQSGSGDASAGEVVSFRKKAERLYVKLYPWWHLVSQLTVLAMIGRFILRKSDYVSPGMWLLNLKIRRAPFQPPPQQPLLGAEEDPTWMSWLREKLREGTAAAPGYLIFGVIYFLQFMSWWYRRETMLQPFEPKKAPPPPEKPPPYDEDLVGKVGAKAIYLLPQDRRICAVCMQPRRNPAAASSGYVFCYPCLMHHVREHGRCPVTGMRCSPDSVRRIYEPSSKP